MPFWLLDIIDFNKFIPSFPSISCSLCCLTVVALSALCSRHSGLLFGAALSYCAPNNRKIVCYVSDVLYFVAMLHFNSPIMERPKRCDGEQNYADTLQTSELLLLSHSFLPTFPLSTWRGASFRFRLPATVAATEINTSIACNRLFSFNNGLGVDRGQDEIINRNWEKRKKTHTANCLVQLASN